MYPSLLLLVSAVAPQDDPLLLTTPLPVVSQAPVYDPGFPREHGVRPLLERPGPSPLGATDWTTPEDPNATPKPRSVQLKTEYPDAPSGAFSSLSIRDLLQEVSIDQPGDDHVWARGRDYRASFGTEGFTVWPVFGSVLVIGQEAFVTAGRSIFLDGGITFYRLDVASGQVLDEQQLTGVDPAGKGYHQWVMDLSMPTGNNEHSRFSAGQKAKKNKKRRGETQTTKNHRGNNSNHTKPQRNFACG